VRRRRHARATSLVELLVGTALALVVLSALTAAVGTGARLLLACGARGEAEDTAQLALEALTFDVRRAGWDPAASGLVAVRKADGLELSPNKDTRLEESDVIVGAGSADEMAALERMFEPRNLVGE